MYNLDMEIFGCLFDILGEIARKRYVAGEKYYAKHGLNHTEGRILRLIQEAQEEISQDELGLQITIDRTNVGRALAKLETAGLIVRCPDPSDKRAKVVKITTQGQALVRRIAKDRSMMLEEFFGNLTKDEAAAAVSLLKKVVESQ